MTAVGPHAVDAAFDVTFARPCRCPESHAVSGSCHQKSEVVTAAGGMCRPCCYAYSGTDWLGGQPLLACSVPLGVPRG